MPDTSRPRHREVRPSRLKRRQIHTTALSAAAVFGIVATVLAGPGVMGSGEAVKSAAAVTAVTDTLLSEVEATFVTPAVGGAEGPTTAEALKLGSMTPSELQMLAARLQADFVKASLAYEASVKTANEAHTRAKRAGDRAAEAEARRERARDDLADQVALLIEGGPAQDPFLMMVGNDGAGLSEVAAGVSLMQDQALAQTAATEEMGVASALADAASEEAETSRLAAKQARAESDALLAQIQAQASKVSAVANLTLASKSAAALYADEEQQARNEEGLRQWKSYLSTLRDAQVVSPTSDALADPDDLPYGLEPVISAKNKPLAGVAQVTVEGSPVTVLPSETVTAVSRAFANIGKPYVAGNSGPATFDCAGFTAAMWRQSGIDFPSDPLTQQKALREVPTENRQVGDLMFFSADAPLVSTTTTHPDTVGIYLGGRWVLTADAVSNQVGVQEMTSEPTIVARPSLPRDEVDSQTREVADEDLETRCGASANTGGAMVYPVKEGTFRFTGEFGQPGDLWESGYHTGLDFAAPTGTPVMASQDGTVTVSSTGWAGPRLVTITHADGLETLYAHMSAAFVETGDVVRAGQVIGAVGAEGNVTGPHLHFEVHLDGIGVDPKVFLGGPSGTAGWGGYVNGVIPETAMCDLAAAPGHRLRCDAANAFDAMSKAYRRESGQDLCLTDSYRSYAAQVALFGTKPDLAAIPGTSNHGWALAVDMCGGVESFSSPAHAWMVQNAGRFGWVLPAWAAMGGSKPEPWHWEFGTIS